MQLDERIGVRPMTWSRSGGLGDRSAWISGGRAANRSEVFGQHEGVRDDPALMTDAALMTLARTDPACFALVFDRYFVTIHRYLACRVGPDLADDLAGEVFRVAFERRYAFDPQRLSARPWLYGIATNLLHGERRSEERRLRALQRAVAAACVPLGVDAFEQTGDRVDAEAAVASIGAAVGQLTGGDRDALVLFAVEGLTYAEVAAALTIPVGTVRSRISRARSRLRELLTASGQQLSDCPDAEERRDG